MCYMRTSFHLLTLGHIQNQSCLSNVESRSFTIDHNGSQRSMDRVLTSSGQALFKGTDAW